MRQFIIYILSLTSFNLLYAQKLSYHSNHQEIKQILSSGDQLFVVINGGGILELSLEGELIKKHTALDGLPSHKVDYLSQNEHGKIYADLSDVVDTFAIYDENTWQYYDGFGALGSFSLIQSPNFVGLIQATINQLKLRINGEWRTLNYPPKEPKIRVLKGAVNFSGVLIENDSLIWVGTENGVLKFENDTISKEYLFLGGNYNSIRQIYKDPRGRIWAFSHYNQDAYYYDKTQDQWLKATEKLRTTDDILSDVLFVDQTQQFWYTYQAQNREEAYNSYLFSYDGYRADSLKIPLVLNERFSDRELIRAINQDKNGAIWLGSNMGYLYKYDGKQWESFSFRDTSSFIIDAGQRLDIAYVDKAEDIWIFASDGILRINPDDLTSKEYSPKMISNYYSSIISVDDLTEDAQGDLWACTDLRKRRLLKYNRATDQWSSERSNNKMIVYDEQNQIYYHLKTNGVLYSIDKDSVETEQKVLDKRKRGRYLFIQDMLVDQFGMVWIAAEGGLYQIDGEEVTVHVKEKAPFDNYIENLLEDQQGRIWAETETGIAYWENEKWTILDEKNSPVSEVSNNMLGFLRAILEDSEGNIYINTRRDILKWNGKEWYTHLSWNQALEGAFGTSIFIDSQDHLWIFNDRKGIYKCTTDDCEPILENFCTDYYQVIEDKHQRLWIFTRTDGCFIYDPNKK